MKEESQKLVDLIHDAAKDQPSILKSAKAYAVQYSEALENGLYKSEKEALKNFKKDICEWRFIDEADQDGAIKLKNVKWEEVVEYLKNVTL